MTRKTRTSVFICSLLLIATNVVSQELPVRWDSLITAYGHGLTVANNGNAGNSGIGGLNLDFIASGFDCTSTEASPADVYLYDLTPIIMQSQTNYSWQPYWSEARASDRDFTPITHPDTSEKSNGVGISRYHTGHFITADSSLGCKKELALHGYNAPYNVVIERWKIYSFDGNVHQNVQIGELIDWNIPSDLDLFNPGSVDSANGFAMLHGFESHSGEAGDCQPADQRFAVSGLLGFYYTAEEQLDWRVNHTDLVGIQIRSKDELFSPADTLLSDSVWNRMSETGAVTNYSQPDQIVLMNYGTFDIIPEDTLVIWTIHGSFYDSDSATVLDYIQAYKNTYEDHWRYGFMEISCCGRYTGGYPGNVDFSTDGKRTLADITMFISNVYIKKVPLICNANADINFDDKLGLADITKLIDHVYISKAEFGPCQ